MQTNEEIKYCRHCGAALKQSSSHCDECDKDTNTRYFAFYDFLKGHIKDDLKDTLTDNILDLIKKFLLSHLYGVILSISIVFTGFAMVTYSTPTVRNADKAPVNAVVEKSEQPSDEPIEQPEESNAIDAEYERWLLGMHSYVFSNYENRAMAGDNDALPYSKIFAEQAIPDFPFKGVHEAKNNNLSLYYQDDVPLTSEICFYGNNIRTGDNMTLAISKQLKDAGYEVFEATAFNYAYYEKPNFDTDAVTNDPYNPAYEPDKKFIYDCSYVVVGDDIYLAEDRIIERK